MVAWTWIGYVLIILIPQSNFHLQSAAEVLAFLSAVILGIWLRSDRSCILLLLVRKERGSVVGISCRSSQMHISQANQSQVRFAASQ